MALDVERARAATPRARRPPRHSIRSSSPRASSASPTPTWSAPSASCRCSAASTRAISRCSRSAAPAACTPARSPTRWTSPTVLVPRHAGVLSALGMLLADVTRDYSLSVLRPADRDERRELRERFAPLVARGGRPTSRRRIQPARIARLERSLDVRYIGQSYEITVPFAADVSPRVRSAPRPPATATRTRRGRPRSSTCA